MKKLKGLSLVIAFMAMPNIHAENKESWEDYFKQKGSAVAQAATKAYRTIAGYNQELIDVAKQGNAERVNELLAMSGIDVNAQDADGNTALMLAAQNGHGAIVKTLLDAGADLRIVNKKGDLALNLAHDNNHSAIADLIAEKMKRPIMRFEEYKKTRGLRLGPGAYPQKNSPLRR